MSASFYIPQSQKSTVSYGTQPSPMQDSNVRITCRTRWSFNILDLDISYRLILETGMNKPTYCLRQFKPNEINNKTFRITHENNTYPFQQMEGDGPIVAQLSLIPSMMDLTIFPSPKTHVSTLKIIWKFTYEHDKCRLGSAHIHILFQRLLKKIKNKKRICNLPNCT